MMILIQRLLFFLKNIGMKRREKKLKTINIKEEKKKAKGKTSK
jgi:hypothetical protein